MNLATAPTNTHKLQAYYRSHACFYDATRWSFLFGRKRMINALPDLPPSARILEIGCGTGTCISLLNERYLGTHITGLDLSRPMLERATKKTDRHSNISLQHKAYPSASYRTPNYDLILLSYSLTMAGEQMEALLASACRDLAANGTVAVVDFHQTPSQLFQHWMQANHVQIDGSALQLLKEYFGTQKSTIRQAYFGLWSYFIFLGNQIN